MIGCYWQLCARDVKGCARSSDVGWWNVMDGFASGSFQGSRVEEMVLGCHM